MKTIHRILLVLPNQEHWLLEVPKGLSEEEVYLNIEEQYYKQLKEEIIKRKKEKQQ